MIRTVATALALTFVISAPGFAAEVRSNPKAVLELFTSQGCSSCPPADAALEQLSKRNDIIALGYHVDYWDYIGWRDNFGDPAFSEYQRAYAKAQGKSGVYTPQLIVNGEKDVVGSHPAEVKNALSSAGLGVPVTLSAHDGMLDISIAQKPGGGTAAVWLVAYKKDANVTIERGENKGRTIDYSHIVTKRQILGMWSGKKGAQITLPLPDALGSDSDGAAIIVQRDNKGLPGPILGAAAFTLLSLQTRYNRTRKSPRQKSGAFSRLDLKGGRYRNIVVWGLGQSRYRPLEAMMGFYRGFRAQEGSFCVRIADFEMRGS